MMLEKIIAILSGDKRISDWKLTQSRRKGLECYFIKTDLDIARKKDLVDYKLTLYVDAGAGTARTRGEYTVMIHPTMGQSEIRAAVERAIAGARGVANPWYQLPDPMPAKTVLPQSVFSKGNLEDHIDELRAALYKANGIGGATINSLELFLTENTTRLINSRGIDALYTRFEGFTEFIVNARAAGSEEIELYDDYRFSSFSAESLSEKVAALLDRAHHRAIAIKTPNLKALPILFSGTYAQDLLTYCFVNCSTERVYGKLSPFQAGKAIMASGGGDPITMHAEAVLPGAPDSSLFDRDGVALERCLCIDKGVLRDFVGPNQHSRYLGLPVHGEFSLFSVQGGSSSEASLGLCRIWSRRLFPISSSTRIRGNLAGRCVLASGLMAISGSR